eukprot:TRINITY_DN39009_c0_g1_i1.p1 TRINITY_DN39009_c0_g1~~TRINITY_DN39009_c0_g1_i1.p1  ORF type:complete len:836 (-),score=109.13 TRINITY_DN39009_c0_g1_i1:86-2458(-)
MDLLSSCAERDLFFVTMGARTTKATGWLNHASTEGKLLVIILAARPCEHLLFKVFKEQSDEDWRTDDVTKMPLVNLASIEFSEPAKALDQHISMLDLKDPHSRLVLQGQSKDVLRDFFICNTSCIAHLWTRLIRPYQKFPWKLARTLDHRVPQVERIAVANEFLEMKTDPSIFGDHCSGPVRVYLSRCGNDVFSPKFQKLLAVLFSGKSCNVTVENAFARATSMRSYLRGQIQGAATMASKHFLAEVKLLHKKEAKTIAASQAIEDETSTEEPPKSSASLHSFSQAIVQCHSNSEQIVVSAPVIVKDSPSEKTKTGVNSWTVFRNKYSNEAVRQDGESLAHFRKRCVSEACVKYRTLKENDKAQLERLQREAAERRSLVLATKPSEKSRYITGYPLPSALLDNIVDSEASFVNNGDMEWSVKQADVIGQPLLPFTAAETKQRDFSSNLPAEERSKFAVIKEAFRSLVRRLSSQKKRGQEVVYISGPSWHRAFYLAEASFSPFDLVMWQCEVSRRSDPLIVKLMTQEGPAGLQQPVLFDINTGSQEIAALSESELWSISSDWEVAYGRDYPSHTDCRSIAVLSFKPSTSAQALAEELSTDPTEVEKELKTLSLDVCRLEHALDPSSHQKGNNAGGKDGQSDGSRKRRTKRKNNDSAAEDLIFPAAEGSEEVDPSPDQHEPGIDETTVAWAEAHETEMQLEQDARGYVSAVIDGSRKQIGRITYFHTDSPHQHAVKAQCYLHSRCGVLKRVATLPAGYERQIEEWFLFGLSLPDRGQCDRHKKEWQCIMADR